jgi:hypothetical protein
MPNHPHRLLLFAALALTVTQCEKGPSGSSAPDADDVLATVAGQPITEADLREEAEWRLSRREAVPGPAELLDEMIERRALLAKARSEGLDEDPATRRRMESILIARLRERDLGKAVAAASVGEEELREAYESREVELSRAGQDRFATMFLEASEKSSETHRAEVLARLEEGVAKSDANPAPGGRGPAAMGFGAVASEYSDDQAGRYRGGDIGWVATGSGSPRVPEGVLEVGRGLAKGERSDIIETPAGFYVIMKTDSRPGGMPSFEEVSVKLHRLLLVEKRRAIEQRFMAETLAAADVSVDSAALDKVTLPTSRKPSLVSEPPAGPIGVPTSSASR